MKKKLYFCVFMRIRNQTTVVLTKKAQGVKDDLAPVFGLKNILSVGLILFDELSCSDQKIIILEANSIQPQQEHTQASKTDPAKKVAQKLIARTKARQAKLDEKKKGKSSKSA